MVMTKDYSDVYERFKNLPGRLFLDTNVVQFTLKYEVGAEDNYDREKVMAEHSKQEIIDDVEALHRIFLVGRRATFQLAVSRKTIDELAKTSNIVKRERLLMWGFEIVDYWINIVESYGKNFDDNLKKAKHIESSNALQFLPDEADKELILQSVALGCDAFLTMDYKSIHRYKENLSKLGIKVMRPIELWNELKYFEALWL